MYCIEETRTTLKRAAVHVSKALHCAHVTIVNIAVQMPSGSTLNTVSLVSGSPHGGK